MSCIYVYLTSWCEVEQMWKKRPESCFLSQWRSGGLWWVKIWENRSSSFAWLLSASQTVHWFFNLMLCISETCLLIHWWGCRLEAFNADQGAINAALTEYVFFYRSAVPKPMKHHLWCIDLTGTGLQDGLMFAEAGQKECQWGHFEDRQ